MNIQPNNFSYLCKPDRTVDVVGWLELFDKYWFCPFFVKVLVEAQVIPAAVVHRLRRLHAVTIM